MRRPDGGSRVFSCEIWGILDGGILSLIISLFTAVVSFSNILYINGRSVMHTKRNNKRSHRETSVLLIMRSSDGSSWLVAQDIEQLGRINDSFAPVGE